MKYISFSVERECLFIGRLRTPLCPALKANVAFVTTVLTCGMDVQILLLWNFFWTLFKCYELAEVYTYSYVHKIIIQ